MCISTTRSGTPTRRWGLHRRRRPVHTCERRSLATPSHHLLDDGLGPFEDRFDVTARDVPDPAGESEPVGALCAGGTEEDSLDPPGDEHPNPAHRSMVAHRPLGLGARLTDRCRETETATTGRRPWSSSTCRTTSRIRGAACTFATASTWSPWPTSRCPRRRRPAPTSSTPRTGTRGRRPTSSIRVGSGRSTA